MKSYFGMRKISVVNLPNTAYPYIALNNQPIYLQLTLDQSYHPEGYYTFPTDAFMKNEIQLCKDIGLNGIRTHIKVDIPRKLYWADKLGLLVMSMYYLAKSLDPTRLVEDNSICCGRGHTETDINSWHEYLPGWAWEEHLSTIDKNTFEGSTFKLICCH